MIKIYKFSNTLDDLPGMNLFLNTRKKIGRNFSLFWGVAIALLSATPAAAFKINFNYEYDDNNFFDDTTSEGIARRATLEQAGQYYENYLNDNLSAIAEDASSTVGIGYEWGSPQRKNTWTISFLHPATGSQTTIENPTFLQNEITIYAGGRDLSSLGTGGTGGLS